MLLLSRRLGETLLIDNGKIVVKVVGLNNSTTLLGIHAPDDIDIDREEIFKLKRATAKTLKLTQKEQGPL